MTKIVATLASIPLLLLTVIAPGVLNAQAADVAEKDQAKKRPNVLMIAIDDLNDWVETVGWASGCEDTGNETACRARHHFYERALPSTIV